MRLPDSVRDLVARGPIAQLVTLNPDGTPQISMAWVGIDGDDLVIGTLLDQVKLRNIRRDPRIAVSMLSGRRNEWGLDEYVVLHGHAHSTPGGAPELLQRLARTYLGPDVRFPPMPDPPPGWVTRITIERIGGLGPWVVREGAEAHTDR
jgi:PPOX class probable F420-dependent enzyme